MYDTQTRSILQTNQQYPSISSQNKNLKANADGSVDVWFAPKAPAGMENNWIQTIPGKVMVHDLPSLWSAGTVV